MISKRKRQGEDQENRTYVAKNTAPLSVELLGVEEGTGHGLESKQTVLLGRVGDGKDDSVGLTVLDDCERRVR